jgi:hypothetical protein
MQYIFCLDSGQFNNAMYIYIFELFLIVLKGHIDILIANDLKYIYSTCTSKRNEVDQFQLTFKMHSV